MPDTKISALTALTAPASGDLFPIVDISDTTMAASGTTKGITYSNLGFLPLAGGTITGTVLFSPDNTLTMGGGANRLNTLYCSTLQGNASVMASGFEAGTSGFFYWASKSVLTSPSDGVIKVSNFAGSDFNLLQFGGTSASFPALKRSAAELHARLADDSGYATTKVQSLKIGANDDEIRPSTGSGFLDLNTSQGIKINPGGAFCTIFNSSGNVGIGTASPSYQLHVNTDSAGKPGASGLWTVVSDERIKENIVPADLSRCYDIVKQVGLKHYGYKPGVYTDAQVKDRNALGWIAQDVQKVFSKAVSVKQFTLQTDIPDGTETYEEQAFTVHITNKVETSIQIIDGKPVRVSKAVQTEEKVMLFDDVAVVDEGGLDVIEAYEVAPAVPASGGAESVAAIIGTRPLTHKMPRMVTKTRPKVRREVIEDCLDLNAGQMHAALYGAVQHLMSVVEAQAEAIAELQASV